MQTTVPTQIGVFKERGRTLIMVFLAPTVVFLLLNFFFFVLTRFGRQRTNAVLSQVVCNCINFNLTNLYVEFLA